MTKSRRRLAVVLFNLGAPDSRAAIKPFLRNLFMDRAILRAPLPIRFFLARFIAGQRLGPATENYALLDYRSPLLDLTRQQADALQDALRDDPDWDARCFIAMRYWHPFSRTVVQRVREWQPDHVVLLPLYPHYSTTTSGSSLTDWRQAAVRVGLVADTTTLCCWHSDPAFVESGAASLRAAYQDALTHLPAQTRLRVLFSAHGLPESIVTAGDPYRYQIERHAAALARAMDVPKLDHRICYQSRATPQKWLEPSTEHEIAEAARDQVALLVVPIAFVSDHSETLVELDVEYRALADRLGVPGYFRAPAPNAHADFIAALAGITRKAATRGPGLCSSAGGRLCPASHSACPHPALVTPSIQ